MFLAGIQAGWELDPIKRSGVTPLRRISSPSCDTPGAYCGVTHTETVEAGPDLLSLNDLPHNSPTVDVQGLAGHVAA